MGARDIWDSLDLATDPWAALTSLVVEGRTEGAEIDFKKSDASDGKPNRFDVKNLAKALSAFANTAGGVLLFGIETDEKAGGKATALVGVPHVEGFAKMIDDRARDRVEPRVSGVRIRPFRDTANPSRGIVGVYIPLSDGGPHRVVNLDGKESEWNEKYLMRMGANCHVMPHRQLAAMFGMNPPPVLRVVVRCEPHDDFRGCSRLFVGVRNAGRGVARSVLFRFAFEHVTWKQPFGPMQGCERHLRRGMANDLTAYAFEHLVYPEERVDIVHGIAGALGEWNTTPILRGRVDAEGAQPVLFSIKLRTDPEWEIEWPI